MPTTTDGEKSTSDPNARRSEDGGSRGMVRHFETICVAVDSGQYTERRDGGHVACLRRLRRRRFVMGLSPRVALLVRAGHARPVLSRGCAELESRCADRGRHSAKPDRGLRGRVVEVDAHGTWCTASTWRDVCRTAKATKAFGATCVDVPRRKP